MIVDLPDHYAVLHVEEIASSEEIRHAFRHRLLEVHPDKARAPVDPEAVGRVMEAFEVLSDPDQRDRYDQQLDVWRRASGASSSLPHVTESKRPVDRARAILYLFLAGREGEALARVAEAEDPAAFLTEHLEVEEFIDAAFLLAEVHEKRRSYALALQWYQEILRREEQRRFHRPCYGEVLERSKKILIHRLAGSTDPRSSLCFLDRAERLGLNRGEKIEVLKRRAQSYRELDMLDEAARHLREALQIQPRIKGVQKLEKELADYL